RGAVPVHLRGRSPADPAPGRTRPSVRTGPAGRPPPSGGTEPGRVRPGCGSARGPPFAVPVRRTFESAGDPFLGSCDPFRRSCAAGAPVAPLAPAVAVERGGADRASPGVQRAADAERAGLQDVGVHHRGADVLVTEQLLDRPNVMAGFAQVSREAVP